MAHRIREAMRSGGLDPLGGADMEVEADETYYGRKDDPKPPAQRRGRPYTKRKKPFDKRAIATGSILLR